MSWKGQRDYSYELVDRAEGTRVRVLPVGQEWSVSEVKDILKDG
jgi:hypothetical protein